MLAMACLMGFLEEERAGERWRMYEAVRATRRKSRRKVLNGWNSLNISDSSLGNAVYTSSGLHTRVCSKINKSKHKNSNK